MYLYQGPPKPFKAIMSNAKPITATNNNFVMVFNSMSSKPTLERGCELFITDLVSGPVYITTPRAFPDAITQLVHSVFSKSKLSSPFVESCCEGKMSCEEQSIKL